MFTLVIAIHVVICGLLILLVLIQQGRGGGLIDSFSSAESIFGTKTNTFLVKATSLLATAFFLTCLSLAFLSLQKGKSLLDTSYQPGTEQPALPTGSLPAAAPAAATATSTTEPAPVPATTGQPTATQAVAPAAAQATTQAAAPAAPPATTQAAAPAAPGNVPQEQKAPAAAPAAASATPAAAENVAPAAPGAPQVK